MKIPTMSNIFFRHSGYDVKYQSIWQSRISTCQASSQNQLATFPVVRCSWSFPVNPCRTRWSETHPPPSRPPTCTDARTWTGTDGWCRSRSQTTAATTKRFYSCGPNTKKSKSQYIWIPKVLTIRFGMVQYYNMGIWNLTFWRFDFKWSGYQMVGL